mmetsp:Transcript_20791/g.30951  ORF Transcript_20791/g.30951 Transcript_20791/m.30951 type:complete len:104 (-) Transcript_20791:40-351(-)
MNNTVKKQEKHSTTSSTQSDHEQQQIDQLIKRRKNILEEYLTREQQHGDKPILAELQKCNEQQIQEKMTIVTEWADFLKSVLDNELLISSQLDILSDIDSKTS